MDQKETNLERLIALAREAEEILGTHLDSHDVRHACAVARGYLDLARSYNEPVNVQDVERVLARMRTALHLKTPDHDSDHSVAPPDSLITCCE